MRRQLHQYDKQGASDELLKRVAPKIARRKDDSLKNITSVAFAKGKYNFDQYFIYQNKTPKREKIIATYKLDRK